jgi:ADP-ribosylglycohydrolase
MNSNVDSIKGVIFGQAIGDALGLATEYMTKEQVTQNYPNIDIFTFSDIIQDYHRKTWKQGDWTDDTDQMIIIIKSIIEANKVDPIIFAKHFDNLLQHGLPECEDTKCYGPGDTANMWWGDDYSLINPQLAAIRTNIYSPYYPMNNCSPGAIMRTAILGTYEHADYVKVVTNAIKIASATHSSPKSVYSAMIVSYLVARIINDKINNVTIDIYWIREIISDSINFTKDYLNEYFNKICLEIEKIKISPPNISDPYDNVLKENITKYYSDFIKENTPEKIIKEVENLQYVWNIELLELDKNSQHTFKQLGCVFWALNQFGNGNDNSNNYHEIISRIIKEGGDADTNCAVVGGVIGALVGYVNLPDKLKSSMAYFSVLESITNSYLEICLSN